MGIPGDLIDAKEAARLVGVKPKTVRGWSRKGRLRPWRIAGTLVRFSRADVLALVVPEETDEAPAAPATFRLGPVQGGIPAWVVQQHYANGVYTREQYQELMKTAK